LNFEEEITVGLRNENLHMQFHKLGIRIRPAFKDTKAQKRDQLRALVNTGMNLGFHKSWKVLE
jgi:hypothetical protein